MIGINMTPHIASVTDPQVWTEWVLWAAGFLVAVSTIWRLAVRPIARIINGIDRISAEFEANGGNSMKDQLNEIQNDVASAIKLGETAQRIAEAAKVTAEVGRALIEQEQRRGIELTQHVHDRFLSILTEIQTLKGGGK